MLKTRAFGPAKASRATSIVCRAESGMPRRALLAATFGLTALASRPALALIPDEEDEELLERAKAKRKERLAQQEQTTRDFIREEGLKDVRLDQELIPVQKAVQQLSKSGKRCIPLARDNVQVSVVWLCELHPTTQHNQKKPPSLCDP